MRNPVDHFFDERLPVFYLDSILPMVLNGKVKS
jgi:hypothetical protein